MSYWNSSDGIEGTALEFSRPVKVKCDCGCDVLYPEDQVTAHPITGEMISSECREAYDLIVENENIYE